MHEILDNAEKRVTNSLFPFLSASKGCVSKFLPNNHLISISIPDSSTTKLLTEDYIRKYSNTEQL